MERNEWYEEYFSALMKDMRKTCKETYRLPTCICEHPELGVCMYEACPYNSYGHILMQADALLKNKEMRRKRDILYGKKFG